MRKVSNPSSTVKRQPTPGETDTDIDLLEVGEELEAMDAAALAVNFQPGQRGLSSDDYVS